MKVCTKCGIEKDESEFYKNKRFGRTHWCKACFTEAKQTQREQNPSRRARDRECAENYYYEHHEERKAILRARSKTPEFKAYERDWKRTPKGRAKVARMNAKRRERTRNDAKLSVDDINDLLVQQNHECSRCSRPFTKERPHTLDHIVPASKGGVLAPGNVQLLCRSCNSKKGNRE